MVSNLLITLEGIDGSGKTTIARILARELVSMHIEKHFVFTAEPTPSKAGEILRSGHLTKGYFSPEEEISNARKMEELFLFVADHADHLVSKVMPALKMGSIVISDRYIDSTAAYQGATIKDIVPNPVCWIWDLYRPWNKSPDLTILFALDPAIGLKRVRCRPTAEGGLERFERESFLREVDSNFRLLARMEPERFAIIDADNKIEDVAKMALSQILQRIEH